MRRTTALLKYPTWNSNVLVMNTPLNSRRPWWCRTGGLRPDDVVYLTVWEKYKNAENDEEIGRAMSECATGGCDLWNWLGLT